METLQYSAKQFKLVCLREIHVSSGTLDNPAQCAQVWRETIPQQEWFDKEKESFVVFFLSVRRKLKGFHLVSLGNLDTCVVHPREVFRPAIVACAAAVILFHNHPSGDPTPSEPDVKVTRDIMRAGQLLKIEVLDHIVIGHPSTTNEKGFSSLRDLGYF